MLIRDIAPGDLVRVVDPGFFKDDHIVHIVTDNTPEIISGYGSHGYLYLYNAELGHTRTAYMTDETVPNHWELIRNG